MLFLVSIIVTLGMVKEGLSDRQRVKADKSTNYSKNRRIVKIAPVPKEQDPLAEARRKGSLRVKGIDANGETCMYSYHSEEVKCEDLLVGDLIVLKDNMKVPADCILIKCPASNGECQIQTG